MASGASTQGGYEIPNEMRDFAEKSVEQARKAFDGFMEAAQKTSTSLETQTATAHENVRVVGGAAVSYAEANMAASFAFAQKLVRARTLEEMVALQAEFAKAQIETLTKQVSEMGAVISRRAQTKP